MISNKDSKFLSTKIILNVFSTQKTIVNVFKKELPHVDQNVIGREYTYYSLFAVIFTSLHFAPYKNIYEAAEIAQLDLLKTIVRTEETQISSNLIMREYQSRFSNYQAVATDFLGGEVEDLGLGMANIFTSQLARPLVRDEDKITIGEIFLYMFENCIENSKAL